MNFVIVVPLFIFISLVLLFIGVMKLRDKKTVFGVVMLVIAVVLIILAVIVFKEFLFYQEIMRMIYGYNVLYQI